MSTLTVDEILGLPVAERLRLLEVIWESLASRPESIPLSDELKSELDRRYREFQANPEAGISWDEAREQIVRGTWRST
jgi:putative addiction module component (TIGR02574 family)